MQRSPVGPPERTRVGRVGERLVVWRQAPAERAEGPAERVGPPVERVPRRGQDACEVLALGELAVHELDVAHERSVVGRSGACGGKQQQAGLELDDGALAARREDRRPVRRLLPERLHPLGDPARVAAWHGDALRGAPHLGAGQDLIESAEVVDAAAEHAARDVDEPGLDQERRQPASEALDDRVRARAVSLGEAPDGGFQGRREVFAQDRAAVGARRPDASACRSSSTISMAPSPAVVSVVLASGLPAASVTCTLRRLGSASVRSRSAPRITKAKRPSASARVRRASALRPSPVSSTLALPKLAGIRDDKPTISKLRNGPERNTWGSATLNGVTVRAGNALSLGVVAPARCARRSRSRSRSGGHSRRASRVHAIETRPGPCNSARA